MRSPPPVLRTGIVTVALPTAAPIGVTLPKPEPVIDVAWPVVRVVQPRAPSPAVIVPRARPPGWQRLGRVRIWSPPPRRTRTG
jgi:hypothetical protein